MAGCRSVVPVTTSGTEAESPSTTAQLTWRLFIIVHGDASYLYHGPDGRVHEADVETLNEAFSAAQSLPRAEVFIFHQRPRDRLLGIFPRDDGTLYHFRRGRLHRQITYDQNRDVPLAEEAALAETHRAPAPDSSLFTAALYYGHAVPGRQVAGYHQSAGEVSFGISALAKGFGRLSRSGRFDTVVLSTCNGGAPPSVAAVAPYGRTLVAAPGDLHLSFIDADLLPDLSAPKDSSTPTPEVWANRLAERAFDRLNRRVATTVTLATYDLGRVRPTARRMARQVAPDTSTAPTGTRHVDCRQVLDVPVDTAGVQVWHRPAQFGRQAGQEDHSGWGCPKLRREQASAGDRGSGDRSSRVESGEVETWRPD